MSNVSILVVDDEPRNVLALEAALDTLECHLVKAYSGLEALKRVLAQDFAVIVLDIHMPGMDGFETASLIRARERSRLTPIIFLTADDRRGARVLEGYRLGAADYLYKPFDPDILRAKVGIYVELFRKTAALEHRTVELTQLTETLALYEAAAIHMTDGLMILDPSDRVMFLNPRMEQLKDVSAEEARDHTLWDVEDHFHTRTSHPEETRRQSKAARDAALAGATFTFDLELGGDRPRDLVVFAFPIRGPVGQILGHGRLARDVTREREVDRLKDDFLSMVSHELRTPMNGVVAMTDLLLDSQLDADQRECAEIIRDSGNALVTIVNDILDASHLKAGRLDLEQVELDVRGVVEQVVDVMVAPARKKGVELVGLVDRAVPQLLYGDPGRFHQVLTNLVGNAVKFTKRGDVSVQIRVAEETDGDVILRCEVVDTGIGAQPHTIAGLFEPFVQADSSVTRRYGGTGLGLAICKRLVDAWGGEIGASTEPGRGSTFWFTVRLKKSDGPVQPRLVDRKPDGLRRLAARAVPIPRSALSTQVADDAPRVLVVDDSEVNRRVAERMLARLGYRTESGNSGLVALNLLALGEYAAVLMDCRMPDMDGFAATTEIRREERGPRRTPIIAMTANAEQGSRERCLAAGMDDYLSKPVQMAELERILGHWIVSAPTETVIPGQGVEDGGTDTLLDPEVIAHLHELDEPGEPGLLTELIEALRRSAPGHIARLKGALAAGDATAFGDAAHALKGSAATLGAARLRSAAYDLELRGRDHNLVDAEAQVSALESTCTEALEALAQEDARSRQLRQMPTMAVCVRSDLKP